MGGGRAGRTRETRDDSFFFLHTYGLLSSRQVSNLAFTEPFTVQLAAANQEAVQEVVPETNAVVIVEAINT